MISQISPGVSLERRDRAVRTVMKLKKKYPDFIWNNKRTVELTLSENARLLLTIALLRVSFCHFILQVANLLHPFAATETMWIATYAERG